MDKRVFDTGEPLSDRESTGFEKAFIVSGDDCMPIGRPGKMMVEVSLEKDRETMGSMSFPRIREVSGKMVIDTMGEMLEEIDDSQDKPKRGGRQDAFGKFLRKGKKW